MDGEYTMVTTVDSDIHLFEMDVPMVRSKAKADHWLETVDGHFVRGDKVVSVWVPDEHMIQGFFESADV